LYELYHEDAAYSVGARISAYARNIVITWPNILEAPPQSIPRKGKITDRLRCSWEIEEGNGGKCTYRISRDRRLGNISGYAINRHIGYSITSSPPVEGEAQASYACAISSYKLYPKAIRPYEAVSAQEKVIGNVKGVAAVVFTAGAAFNVAILGTGKVLASGALRTFFTPTAPHHPGGKQDDSEHCD
jgi:hypothetical protein